jgi:hypothetical protein
MVPDRGNPKGSALRRWLVGLWTVLCLAVLVVAVLLVVDGHGANDDADATRHQTRSIDATRTNLDVESAALTRDAAAASNHATELSQRAEPLERATKRVIDAFDAYVQRVAATDVAQSARIAALNQAVAAAGAHDNARLQSVLADDVPKSKAALDAAIAAQAQARAQIDVALAALDAARR